MIPSFYLFSEFFAILFLRTVSVLDVVAYSIALNLSALSFSLFCFKLDAVTLVEKLRVAALSASRLA